MTLVTFAQLTDPGRLRARNDDCLCAVEPENEALLRTRGRLFVVADGMGGHARGDVASRLAVETVRTAYYAADALREDPLRALDLSVQTANEVLYRESQCTLGAARMGTTLTSLVIRKREAFLAHVGDSRAYLVRGRDIRQLTEDHSLVSELVRRGVISSDEAERHPSAHVILRALGVEGEVSVELQGPLPLLDGDTLVLCTDGLSRLVAPPEIRCATQARSPLQACEHLVSLANLRGGPDNITLQVIRIGGRRRVGAGIVVLAACAALARYTPRWLFKQATSAQEQAETSP